jgi:hypothetical protein
MMLIQAFGEIARIIMPFLVRRGVVCPDMNQQGDLQTILR